MSGPGFELGYLESPAGRMAFVRRGGGQLFVLQPLFEERNRTRRLVSALARRLAERGLGSWVVDLPGTGDSAGTASWAAWADGARAAFAASGATHLLSIRGGTLLDSVGAAALYRLAPVAGERVLQELLRARAAADDGASVASLNACLAAGKPIELAGYPVDPALAQALREARPAEASSARLAAVGQGEADVAFPGPAPWRQNEPGDASALAAALTDDVAAWMDSCPSR